jgi:hypothetical protein
MGIIVLLNVGKLGNYKKEKNMDYNYCTNVVGELISKELNGKCSFLDKNNILWKLIDDEWIGKRSVYTFQLRPCWLEDASLENIRSWWCGKDADYNEIFKRTKK